MENSSDNTNNNNQKRSRNNRWKRRRPRNRNNNPNHEQQNRNKQSNSNQGDTTAKSDQRSSGNTGRRSFSDGRDSRRNRNNRRRRYNNNRKKSAEKQAADNEAAQKRKRIEAALKKSSEEFKKSIEVIKSTKHDCFICKKPINDMLSAIKHKSGDDLCHFECVQKEVLAQEELVENEKMIYIGNGDFGIIQQRKNRGKSYIFMRKRIHYREKSNGKKKK